MSVIVTKYILSFDWLNFKTAKRQNILNRIAFGVVILIVAALIGIELQIQREIETIAVASQKNEALRVEYKRALDIWMANNLDYAKRHGITISEGDKPPALIEMRKPVQTVKPSMLPLFMPTQFLRAQLDFSKFTENGWIGVIVGILALIGLIATLVFKLLTKVFDNFNSIATVCGTILEKQNLILTLFEERIPRNRRD